MDLDEAALRKEAALFSAAMATKPIPQLFGVTDGKAVGTFLEAEFRAYLRGRGYSYNEGNAAMGLDFPDLKIDIKTTSVKQPQSSCPFRSIRQKIYGLGYSLLVFVYNKADDEALHAAVLNIGDTVFVEASATADYQMTKGLRELLDSGDVVKDEISDFIASRHLTADEIELQKLAEEVAEHKPEQGYLTISPALQWRLQYTRVIREAGKKPGVLSIYRA